MTKREKIRVNVPNSEIDKRDDYTDVLKKIKNQKLCPFCEEHLFKHHREPILFKGKHWLVTKNAWPYKGTKNHFLLIARKHVESIEDMGSSAWVELHSHQKRLVKEYNIKGETLFIRSGETGMTGASVNHLHAQIVVGSRRNKNSIPIKALIGFKKTKK